MTQTWARLEPELEADGTVYAQRLVIEFDNDWQEWSLKSSSGGKVRFTLHLPQDMANALPEMLTA